MGRLSHRGQKSLSEVRAFARSRDHIGGLRYDPFHQPGRHLAADF